MMDNFVDSKGIKHWSVAMLLMLCVLLAFFDKISIAVLFNDAEFLADFAIGTQKAKLGLLMTSFLLAYGVSSICLSFLGDLFSPKKILMYSVSLWGLLMLAMGFSSSYGWLIFWRVLLGMTEGPLFAVAFSIVKKTYSSRQQARASTLFLLGTPIGASLGFPITAYILNLYNWQSTFFFMASLSLVLLLVLRLGLKEIDGKLAKTLPSTAIKLNYAQHANNVRLLSKNYKFWFLCFFNIAFMSYLWGLNSWVPNYLMESKQFSLKSFGVFAALPFICMLLGEILGAMRADRTGKYASQVFVGLFVAGVFMYLMVFSNTATLVLLAMSVSAGAWGVGSSAVFALLASVTQAEVSATAGGVFNGLGNLSSAVVPFAVGVVVQISHDFNYGITCIAFIAILGSFLLLPLLLGDKNAVRFKSIKE